MKRMLAIWLPNWPVQRLLRAKPELNGQPVVLHHNTRRGQCVVACSHEARELGIQEDMPLAEAMALLQQNGTVECGDLSPLSHSIATFLKPYDPVADRIALEELATWSHRFSPFVGLEDTDPPDTLLLNVTGITALFGGEQPLAKQVERSFQQLGLAVQIGLANTLGAAWAFAHYRTSNVELPTLNIESLPVAALRLPPQILVTLDRLGLERIGDLLLLPRTELKSRFGPLLLKRLDQVFGRAAEVIRSVHPPPEFNVEWLFEYPVDQPNAIDHAVRQLIDRLCFLLRDRGQGALHLICRLDCQTEKRGTKKRGQVPFVQSTGHRPQVGRTVPAKGTCPLFSVGLFRPSADTKHLQSLLEIQMEKWKLPGSITGLSIRVDNHAPLAGRQQELFDQHQRRQDSPQVSALVDRLAGRLGRDSVVGCTLQSDAQPEMAFFDEPLVNGTLGAGASIRARQTTFAPLDRPLHLLTEPALLQVNAVVPDGPPIRFQYGGHKHDVSRHWGPERIETGWWRQRGVRRDYYRVETKEGHRFWLFRRMQDGHWFLHGIFD